MICRACLRNVPKLIGRDQLCPECFSAANADLIPEVFDGILDQQSLLDEQHSLQNAGWGEKFPECENGYSPEFSSGCVGEEPAWSLDGSLFEDEDDDDFGESWKNTPGETIPRFKGWPRF